MNKTAFKLKSLNNKFNTEVLIASFIICFRCVCILFYV